MTKKLKKRLTRIIISVVLFVILFVAEKTELFEKIFGETRLFGLESITVSFVCLLVFSLAVYLFSGLDVLKKAAKNIAHGQVFDENFLMVIATIGAFAIGEFVEAAAVMIFYQVGEWFQSYAVGKSRNSIKALMEIVPDHANKETENGLEEVDPEDVHTGEIFVVKPGEKVPLDGIVLSGSSFIDTSSMTGESLPREVNEGAIVVSGTVNLQGLLRVRATSEYENSTVQQVLELVENASSRKAQSEQFITKFAKYYTPVVTIAAALLAVIPPIVITLMGQGSGWSLWGEWIRRACTFLVISCPCALVISVPLSFFGGIGAASKIGALVKGSNYLEAMAHVTQVAVDKTGTLTTGRLSVSKVETYSEKSDCEILALAATVEQFSDHPIAKAIVAAGEQDKRTDVEVHEKAGHGMEAKLDGVTYLVGNAKLLTEAGLTAPESDAVGSVVYVATESQVLGMIVVEDTEKEGVREALSDLKEAGVKKTVMLSGDRTKTAETVAKRFGLDEVRADLLPEDKVSALEGLMEGQEKGCKTAYVGDGINDAPVLVRADVGIAMGGIGSQAAIEAADIVLMDDEVSKLPRLVKVAKKTLGIVRENIVFALGVKLIVLILGAIGFASMWLAMIADVGVAVLAILNAMRCLNVAKAKRK